MHVCLPDTREVKPAHGSPYLLYNVHIDGLYHCSLRYKQLLHLHKTLTQRFNNSTMHNSNQHPQILPPFPPKKLLPLSANQIEERRQQLEKYLQIISQDKAISNSSIFNMFLLEAQRESTRINESQAHLDIELVNGQKIRLQIMTHDSADSILTAVCRALGLNDQYHAYFCLCLCGYDVVRDKLIIKRRLSLFESPYLTLQMAHQQQEQLQDVLSSSGEAGFTSLATPHHVSAPSNRHSPPSQLTPDAIANMTRGSNGNSSDSSDYNNSAGKICHCNSCQQQHCRNPTSEPISYGTDGSQNVSLVSSSDSSYINISCRQSTFACDEDTISENAHCCRPRPRAGSSTMSPSVLVTHRILLRKSYWDAAYDTHLLSDQQALNLLFIQTVYDVRHSRMFVNKEVYNQLETLLAADSKLEYILLARTLKYYNYIHFEPCLSDYPRPATRVMISIGSKELNMRVLNPSRASPNGSSRLEDMVEEEYNFKVPLIRCWRLTSLETLTSNSGAGPPPLTPAPRPKRKSLSLFNSTIGTESTRQDIDQRQSRRNLSCTGTGGVSLLAALAGNHHQTRNHCYNQSAQADSCSNAMRPFSQYELSFEYLISKYALKWITISSDQAIFIGISLQGVVDELVSKRDLSSALYANASLAANSDPGAPPTQSLALDTVTIVGSANVGNGGITCDSDANKTDEALTYMCQDGRQRRIDHSSARHSAFHRFGSSPGNLPVSVAQTVARQRQHQPMAPQGADLMVPSSSSSNGSGTGGVNSFASFMSSAYSFMSHSPTRGFFEIPNTTYYKANQPSSTLINDAYEGATNDDDTL